MRELTLQDVPAACRCLKAIGAREVLRGAAKDADSVADIWDRGFDLVLDLIERATEVNAEKEIYRFFSGPFEMTPEEVGAIPLRALKGMLKQLAEENDLADFFDSVRRRMQKV